jgi:hypothetical protein
MVRKSPVESLGSPLVGVVPQVARANGTQPRSRYPALGASIAVADRDARLMAHSLRSARWAA